MEKRLISVANLQVNHENPRFEAVHSETSAIQMMMNEAGKSVLELAKDIAQHGMNPSKSLMVVETERGKFVPAEGNRRVAALKLLHDPTLVKDKKMSEKFTELKKDYGTQIPDSVECVIFPDKASAFRWVNLEHTGRNKGVGVLNWNNTQRSRFIAQYAGKKLARSVQLFDFADENKIKHENVDATTLDRLLATPFVREQIGIEFPDGVIDLAKSKAEVVKNVRKVFGEMSKKGFTVGQVYKSAQAKDWVKKILSFSPTAKEADLKPASSIPKKEALDGEWINGQLWRAYPKQNRVKKILEELKDIDPKQKPNVSAVSLRVLLELAVYVFLNDKGEIARLIAAEKVVLAAENTKRRKESKSERQWEKDWSPDFQRMLKHMSSEDALISDPMDRKALGVFVSKHSATPFLTELNQFIHNPGYEPRPENVLEIWDKLGKLIFRAILPQNHAHKN